MQITSPACFHHHSNQFWAAPVLNRVDTRQNELRFDLVSDVAAFNGFASDWNRLISRARGKCLQFQSHTFISKWLNHFGAGMHTGRADLALLLGYHGDELVMVWPMVLEKRLGVTILQWAGEPVAQYGDVVVLDCAATGQWIQEAFDYLREEVSADVISLGNLRRDGALASALLEAGFSPDTSDIALEVGLNRFADMAEFRSRFSKKRRRHRRRSQTLLEERGPLTFHVHHGGAEAVEIVRKALQFKTDWLTEKGQVSRAFLDERFADFWLEFAQGTNSVEQILVSELRCAGETIAVEVGLFSKAHYIAHIGAFDPAFASYSPGALQMERTIEYLHKLGLDTYDLLPPNDGYKRRWTDDEMAVESFVFANSTRGQAYKTLGFHALKDELKSRFAQLPLGVRRSVANVVLEVTGRK